MVFFSPPYYPNYPSAIFCDLIEIRQTGMPCARAGVVKLLYSCFSLKRDLWGVISASCCFRTFFSPDSGCRDTVLPSDSLVVSRPPCCCGVFSKMPGYSRIISNQTDVESSFNLHEQTEESELTPESGVWLVTWLEYLHCGWGVSTLV